MAMRPVEALWHAIMNAIVSDQKRKPGATVEKLPKEIRDGLKELKSDDALNMRYWK